jgi:hypothetical protein
MTSFPSDIDIPHPWPHHKYNNLNHVDGTLFAAPAVPTSLRAFTRETPLNSVAVHGGSESAVSLSAIFVDMT